ncbi:hypothetical protein R6U77_11990 [Lysinibacillus louembei]|uniref:Uncharacterized protein n=1 Tax=Lysinibacillus louembei TaxID=1470088 RepID=A0ABZ0RQU4_9BACI|nr:hypothetical protein [Lysinibacillus louembei]WPK10602.1 hypothetical protein R6U77_11990 [Lysinibacillus louembei]
MIKELKTVVILDNEIINVGEWDYQEQRVVSNQAKIDAAIEHNVAVDEENYIEMPAPIIETIQRNPLPAGAIVEEREMHYTDEHGWREVSWTPLMTADEKIANLEQEKEQLAQTLDMVLIDLIPALFTRGE